MTCGWIGCRWCFWEDIGSEKSRCSPVVLGYWSGKGFGFKYQRHQAATAWSLSKALNPLDCSIGSCLHRDAQHTHAKSDCVYSPQLKEGQQVDDKKKHFRDNLRNCLRKSNIKQKHLKEIHPEESHVTWAGPLMCQKELKKKKKEWKFNKGQPLFTSTTLTDTHCSRTCRSGSRTTCRPTSSWPYGGYSTRMTADDDEDDCCRKIIQLYRNPDIQEQRWAPI